jgi:hypothetical protein
MVKLNEVRCNVKDQELILNQPNAAVNALDVLKHEIQMDSLHLSTRKTKKASYLNLQAKNAVMTKFVQMDFQIRIQINQIFWYQGKLIRILLTSFLPQF